MKLNEAISKGFAAAKHCMSVVKVLFVFNFIFTVLILFTTPTEMPSSDAEYAFPLALMSLSAAFLFAWVFFEGGSIHYCYGVIKNGSDSLTNFVGAGKKNYTAILTLSVVAWVLQTGIGVVAIFMYTLLSSFNQMTAVAGAVIPLVVGLYFLPIIAYLSPVACVVNDQNARQGFSTARKIVWANPLLFFALSLLTAAVRFGFFYAINFTLMGIAYLFKINMNTHFISSIVVIPLVAYFGVVMGCAFINFYLSKKDQAQISPIPVAIS